MGCEEGGVTDGGRGRGFVLVGMGGWAGVGGVMGG